MKGVEFAVVGIVLLAAIGALSFLALDETPEFFQQSPSAFATASLPPPYLALQQSPPSRAQPLATRSIPSALTGYATSDAPLPPSSPSSISSERSISLTPVTSCPDTLLTPGETYQLSNDIGPFDGTCITIAADGITLDFNGFTIVGDANGADLEYGIEVFANGATIINSSLINFTRGIQADTVSGLRIIGGTIGTIGPASDATNDNTGYGIFLNRVPFFHIENLTITDVRGSTSGGSANAEGIHIQDSRSTGNITNVTIFDTPAGATSTIGISVAASNLTVTRVNVRNMTGNAVSLTAASGITNTLQDSNANSTISITGNNLTITNNTVTQGELLTSTGNNYYIFNNTVSRRQAGLIINGLSATIVQNYTIANNTISVHSAQANGLLLSQRGGNATVANNTVVVNGTTLSRGLWLQSTSGSQIQSNITFANLSILGLGTSSTGIRIQRGFNHTFTTTIVNLTGARHTGIQLENAYNNTFFNITLVNSTFLLNLSNSTDNIFTNLTANSSFGTIEYLEPINATTQNASVNTTTFAITSNLSFVNTTNLTFLNETARVTLSGLPFTDPQIIADFEDDGTFAACSPPDCTEVSFAGGTFIFDVTHFTSHSASETTISSGCSNPITACCNVTSSGAYALGANLTSNGGHCINVTASLVELDCEGYFIFGPASDNGIDANTIENLTVRECNIDGFEYGIYLNDGVNNSLIEFNNFTANNGAGIITDFPARPQQGHVIRNNLFDTNNVGLFLRAGQDSTIQHNTFTTNDRWGIRNGDSAQGNVDNSRISNNTFTDNGLNSYHVAAYNGQWNDVAELHFPGIYSTQTVALPSGTTQVRLTQQGYDSAHIDFASLDGTAPASAFDETTGTPVSHEKLATIDKDVLDAHDKTLRITWNTPGTTLVLHAVEADTGGEPHLWPARGYKTYTVGDTVDYKHHWYPASSHPDGPVVDSFSANSTHLRIFSDVTPDNTLDPSGDWAEARFLIDGVLRTYRISPTDETWGSAAMEYTSLADYEHKTYTFSIPLSQLDAQTGDTLEFKMAYYGTAADPPQGAIDLEQTENHTVTNNSFNGDRNAIVLAFALNSLIENNTIANQLDNGIRFSSISLASENVRFFNNSIDNTTTGIYVDATTNITFINNTATATSTGILLASTTDTFFNQTVIESTNLWIDISSGGTTNNQFNDTTFLNRSAGSIRIPGNATISDLFTVETVDLFIQNNRTLLDSATYPFFNQSAIITLFGLPFTNPQPLVDLEDDGTFAVCSIGSQCDEISYTGGTFAFNVSRFTGYAASEGPFTFTCPTLLNQSAMMTENLTCDGTAVIINADNVELDCAGFFINHSNVDDETYGIVASVRNNITIRNCNVILGSPDPFQPHNIFLNYTNNSVIVNTSAVADSDSQSDALRMNHAYHNLVHNSTLRGDVGSGATLFNSSNNTLENLTGISDSFYGLWFEAYSSNNVVRNYTALTDSSEAIRLEIQSNNNLFENVSGIATNDQGIEIVTLENLTVRNSQFRGVFGDAFRLVFTNHTLVDNVSAVTTSGFGLDLDRAVNATITNSYFESFDNWVVMIREAAGQNNLTNVSIATNTGVPLRFGQVSAPPQNNTFDNITLTINTSSGASWIQTTTAITNNTLRNILFNASNGTMLIVNASDAPTGIDLTATHLNVSHNNSFINTSNGNASWLNATGQITLYNIAFTDPQPLVDFEDDGTFAACSPPDCTEVSFAGGTFIFDVTHFTSHSASETVSSTGCPFLINGTYTLTQNITCPATAVEFTAGDAILDCAGFTIEWNTNGTTGTSGILAENKTGITIQNCTIASGTELGAFESAVNFTNVSHATLTRSSLRTNGSEQNFGLFLDRTVNISLQHNMITVNGTGGASRGVRAIDAILLTFANNTLLVNDTGGSARGLDLESTVNNSVISNNTILVNSSGSGSNGAIELVRATNLTITNNTIQVFGFTGTDVGIDFDAGPNERITITDNRISTNSTFGGANDAIKLDSGQLHHAVIAANTLDARGNSGSNRGIQITVTKNNITAANNTIRTNSASTGSNFGIQFTGTTENSTIFQNNITTNATTSGSNVGIRFTGTTNDTTVASNIVLTDFGGSNFGIAFTSAIRTVNVTNNTVWTFGAGSSNVGIRPTGGATLLRIENNTIRTSNETDNYGIETRGIIDSTIARNVIATSGRNRNRGIDINTAGGTMVARLTIENNTISTTGVEGANDGIRLNGPTVSLDNSTIFGNTISTNGTSQNHGFQLSGARLFNNTFSDNNITARGTLSYGILILNANNSQFTNTLLNDTAEWINSSAFTFTNLTNTTFATPNGSIRIPNLFNLNGTQDLNRSRLNISFNNSFVNSTNLSFINQSAQLTLNAIAFTDPAPIADLEDDGTFASCPEPQCTEVSYDGSTFIFNVSSFTSYAAAESASTGIINLTFDKIDSPDPVVRGTALNYTIEINNTGNATAENLTVVESYSAGVSFASSSPAPDLGNNTWNLGNLSNGSTTTINITVIVGSTLTNGTVLNNSYDVSFQNSTGGTTSANDSELTTVLGVATLTVTKTDSPDPVNNGSTLSYTVTVTNAGDEIAYNITVIEEYDVNITFNGSSPTPTLGNNTFSLGNLTPGASTTLNITVNVSSAMTSGVLNNTVNVTFTNLTGDNTTVSAFQGTAVTTPFIPPPAPVGGGGGGGGTNLFRNANITRNVPQVLQPVSWPTVARSQEPPVPVPAQTQEKTQTVESQTTTEPALPERTLIEQSIPTPQQGRQVSTALLAAIGALLLAAILASIALSQRKQPPKNTAPQTVKPQELHTTLKKLSSEVKSANRLLREFDKKFKK